MVKFASFSKMELYVHISLMRLDVCADVNIIPSTLKRDIMFPAASNSEIEQKEVR